MTDPAVNPVLEGSTAGLPDWATFARKHEWRRAQAAASLAHADPSLQAAVTALSAFQQDVRAKRYPSARRALGSFRQNLDELGEHSPGDAALIGSLAAPATLETALGALEAAQTETDLAPMQEKIAPALAQVLTKAEALNVLGVLHALREETDQARQSFENALDADPDHYRARMNLGNLALEAGDPAGAEAQYREVLKIAPDYDGAHHNLGVALRRQGKLQASVSSIRKAQRLGMRRTQQDAKEEMSEQLRVNPKLRMVRTVGFVVLALILVAILLMNRPAS